MAWRLSCNPQGKVLLLCPCGTMMLCPSDRGTMALGPVDICVDLSRVSPLSPASLDPLLSMVWNLMSLKGVQQHCEAGC